MSSAFIKMYYSTPTSLKIQIGRKEIKYNSTTIMHCSHRHQYILFIYLLIHFYSNECPQFATVKEALKQY